MKQNEFDPADPPVSPSGNPLVEYTQPPVGLSALAVGQLAIAGTLLYWILRIHWAGTQLSSGQWLLSAYPAAVFAMSGFGMALRRGWGWWLTCAIYFYVFFTIPVALALWTLKNTVFPLVDNLLFAGLAIYVLVYLNRPELMRFIRFRSKDGRPRRWVIMTPVAVGCLGAVARLIIELAK